MVGWGRVHFISKRIALGFSKIGFELTRDRDVQACQKDLTGSILDHQRDVKTNF